MLLHKGALHPCRRVDAIACRAATPSQNRHRHHKTDVTPSARALPSLPVDDRKNASPPLRDDEDTTYAKEGEDPAASQYRQ
jgi:hypothetical protein